MKWPQVALLPGIDYAAPAGPRGRARTAQRAAAGPGSMKISVITVCRNAAATLRRTIDSFLAQTHGEKELVIVDGASTDDTLAIVASYADPAIRAQSEPDSGIYDAMNKGLARFSGDAFGFLNADDVFSHPGVLAAIDVCLAENDIASGHVRFLSAPGGKETRRWTTTPWRPGAFARGWAQPHPGVYCRRSVYETVGPFDASYRIGGDYDWLLRVYEVHHLRGGIVDDVVVDMTLGGASTAGPKALWTNAMEALRSRRRWLGAGLVDYAFAAKTLGKIGQLRF